MMRPTGITLDHGTRHGAGTGRRSRSRLGFSLVEVIVAIALFGVSMSALAALSFAVTRRAADTAGVVQRTAVLEGRANDLFSIPWSDLDGRVGCTTINSAGFARQECITVTTVSTTRKRITLTVTPTDTSIDPASIVVERTKPPATNPFRVML